MEKTEVVYKKNQEQKWHWTEQQQWQLKDTVEKMPLKCLEENYFLTRIAHSAKLSNKNDYKLKKYSSTHEASKN